MSELSPHDDFEDHKERKPWEDAQPGEVWVVNIGDVPANWQGVVVSNGGRFLYRDGSSAALDQDIITDGRRIWPEKTS